MTDHVPGRRQKRCRDAHYGDPYHRFWEIQGKSGVTLGAIGPITGPNASRSLLQLDFSGLAGDYSIRIIRRWAVRHRLAINGVVSVTVVAETDIEADALATAVFVLGPDDGMELIQARPRVDALIVTDRTAGSLSRSHLE